MGNCLQCGKVITSGDPHNNQCFDCAINYKGLATYHGPHFPNNELRITKAQQVADGRTAIDEEMKETDK